MRVIDNNVFLENRRFNLRDMDVLSLCATREPYSYKHVSRNSKVVEQAVTSGYDKR